jgi:DNA-binding GntR family transcriptional regulator
MDTRADRVGADEGRSIACQTVHKAFYAAMITARHEPGSALTIRGNADDMAVSPMPVWQAVRRPVSVGALSMHSTWRVSVSNLTRTSFSQVRSAGYLVERALASCAIWRVYPEEINPMYLIDEELDQGIRDADTQRDKPFMRRVVGRIGTSLVADRHQELCAASEARHDDALRLDIHAGMEAFGFELFGTAARF